MTERFAKVTRIRVTVDETWHPPFDLSVLPVGFRRVHKLDAVTHPRPHRLVAVGGIHDGYEEWWVADIECGCEH